MRLVHTVGVEGTVRLVHIVGVEETVRVGTQLGLRVSLGNGVVPRISCKGFHYPCHNVQMMKQQCQQTEQCVGFTTNGELKNHLKPRHMWTKSESVGLHVASRRHRCC